MSDNKRYYITKISSIIFLIIKIIRKRKNNLKEQVSTPLERNDNSACLPQKGGEDIISKRELLINYRICFYNSKQHQLICFKSTSHIKWCNTEEERLGTEA